MKLPARSIFLILAVVLTTAAAPRQAEQGLFAQPEVTFRFGQYATFSIDWLGVEAPEQVYLYIQPSGGEVQVLEIDPVPGPDRRFRHTVSPQQLKFRPFAATEFWFQATFSGEQLTSAVERFDYADNRKEWQNLQNGSIEVYWQQGDLAFGQSALNTALIGLEKVRQLVPFEVEDRVRIYIYPSAPEWQSAINLGQVSWFSGHATPDLGVLLVAVPPGPDESFEIERQIPHELMHIAQYQAAGGGFDWLPWWFSEGQASLVELYPNPEYEHAVEQAARDGSLLELSSLCDAFPHDSQGAFLAYAQSAAFVSYLHRNFGTSGLTGLMDAYKDGLGCSEAVQDVFGRPLHDLDADWRRAELGLGELSWAVGQLSPYLLLLGVFIVPLPLAWAVARRSRSKRQG